MTLIPLPRTELNVLQKVHHPHCVQFFGAVTKHTPYMIITEYMGCGSMADVFKKAEVPSMRRAVQLALDCARGIAYLHNHQPLSIIHRWVDKLLSRALACGLGCLEKGRDFWQFGAAVMLVRCLGCVVLCLCMRGKGRMLLLLVSSRVWSLHLLLWVQSVPSCPKASINLRSLTKVGLYQLLLAPGLTSPPCFLK